MDKKSKVLNNLIANYISYERNRERNFRQAQLAHNSH